MIRVHSFAKINLGLASGAVRSDGFHQLRTIYQTIRLHDVVEVELVRGSGVEIHCADSRVPSDETNTCYRIAERVRRELPTRGRVVIRIQKRLPIEGGLGGASSNAAATMLALERVLNRALPGADRLRIAGEVGSDLPLFLVGGTVLGVGRGEEVYPLPDLPVTACVLVSPKIGVSTPAAFRDWDQAQSEPKGRARSEPFGRAAPKLTVGSTSDRIMRFSRAISAWLSGFSGLAGNPLSGVPATGRGRVETLLLGLVHTGIENDFEKVVFPKYPELYEIKKDLQRAGALYASLSGSGSALYGLFRTRQEAEHCALSFGARGVAATATATLARGEYWRKFWG
jgi:4-diphosphocytidyl-2-C-methyl-D-erythritol kinase